MTTHTLEPIGAVAEQTSLIPSGNRLLTAFLAFGIVLMSLYVMVAGYNLLVPFAVAVLLWFIINAIANAFGRIELNGKKLPGWGCLTASILAITAALVLVGELIAENISTMVAKAPDYESRFEAMRARLGSAVGLDDLHATAGVIGGADLSSILIAFANAAAGLVGSAGLIFVYVFFLLIEQQVFRSKIAKLLPEKHSAERTREIVAAIRSKILTYLSRKSATSAMMGGVTWIGLALIGVDFAAFWGFVAFLMNFIPTVGGIISLLLPTILALLQFDTIWPAIGVLVGVGGVQAFIANAIEPRFIGQSLNLSPLAVMLALSVWGAIWGVVGMFLCMPLTVILMIVLAEFPSTRPVVVALSAEGEIR